MLLVDAGNTFIKWVRSRPGETFTPDSAGWKHAGALRYHELTALKDAWEKLNREMPIRRVLISNVAGQAVAKTLEGFLTGLDPAPWQISWFHSEAALAGIKNSYRDVTKLGSDRFASMIGARSLCPDKALVVVTAGTATTIDTVSPDGTFLGGMILPGLKLMADSLAHNTAQLPDIGRSFSDAKMFADNTQSAILSGCINAQAGAIERAVRIHGEKFSGCACLLSGGAARYIAPMLSIPFRIIDNLVLIGLHASLFKKTV